MFSESELRGLEAGFPAFKNGNLLNHIRSRLMCINADEGEPGTFKDEFYLNKILIGF